MDDYASDLDIIGLPYSATGLDLSYEDMGGTTVLGYMGNMRLIPVAGCRPQAIYAAP